LTARRCDPDVGGVHPNHDEVSKALKHTDPPPANPVHLAELRVCKAMEQCK